MAGNPYDLTVHDIQVQDVAVFSRTGQVVMQKRVTFFVGEHGPFILTYPADQANTQRIKSDIDAQVRQLAELAGVPPAS